MSLVGWTCGLESNITHTASSRMHCTPERFGCHVQSIGSTDISDEIRKPATLAFECPTVHGSNLGALCKMDGSGSEVDVLASTVSGARRKRRNRRRRSKSMQSLSPFPSCGSFMNRKEPQLEHPKPLDPNSHLCQAIKLCVAVMAALICMQCLIVLAVMVVMAWHLRACRASLCALMRLAWFTCAAATNRH